MSALNGFTPTMNRRELHQGLLGTGLSFALPALGLRAANSRGKERPKSLITVWLNGGASQLETWDPKPGTKIGGPTKAINTSLQGVQIAEFFPQIAEQLKHLSVIRSLVSKEGDHERGTYYLKTGHRPDPTLVHPSVGAIATHELPDTRVEIPHHISLGNSPWPARGGYLGEKYDAFRIYDPGRNLPNLRSRVSPERQERRLKNFKVSSESFQRGRPKQTNETLHQQIMQRALTMMSTDQLAAFELTEESTAMQRAYGDSNFACGCLVARRLVERGVRAVEVNLSGFDSHANNFESHKTNGGILDPAFAQLIRDLRERDLWDSTILLCISEFGRTPRINPLDGRDHWPNGFSCLLGGGGLQSGIVLGETSAEETSRKAMPKDPIEVQDLYATVLSQLGIEHEEEQLTNIGRPMAYSYGKRIPKLIKGF